MSKRVCVTVSCVADPCKHQVVDYLLLLQHPGCMLLSICCLLAQSLLSLSFRIKVVNQDFCSCLSVCPGGQRCQNNTLVAKISETTLQVHRHRTACEALHSGASSKQIWVNFSKISEMADTATKRCTIQVLARLPCIWSLSTFH